MEGSLMWIEKSHFGSFLEGQEEMIDAIVRAGRNPRDAAKMAAALEGLSPEEQARYAKMALTLNIDPGEPMWFFVLGSDRMARLFDWLIEDFDSQAARAAAGMSEAARDMRLSREAMESASAEARRPPEWLGALERPSWAVELSSRRGPDWVAEATEAQVKNAKQLATLSSRVSELAAEVEAGAGVFKSARALLSHAGALALGLAIALGGTALSQNREAAVRAAVERASAAERAAEPARPVAPPQAQALPQAPARTPLVEWPTAPGVSK